MKKIIKAILQIIFLLTVSACQPRNENFPVSQVVNTFPATTTSIPECKFNNLAFPTSSQFNPISNNNAIAYSDGSSAGGLTLFFPDTENKIIIRQLNKLGVSGIDTSFAWSPTGTKIAFLHSRVTEGRMDNKAYIMLADLSKGTICPLLNTPLIYTSTIRLFWSPNEEQIVWNDNGKIDILSVQEGIIKNFAQDSSSNPQWININHIGFIRKTNEVSKQDLVIQSVDDLSSNVILSEVSNLFSFSFSPDNKWLVYSYSKPRESLHEFFSMLINLDTGVEEHLGKGIYTYWSPNSQYLLGSYYGNVYLVQPNTPNQINDLGFNGCLNESPWSKDSLNFVISLCNDGTKKSLLGVYSLEDMKLLELNIEIQSPVVPAWNSH